MTVPDEVLHRTSGEWLKRSGVPHFSTQYRSWAGIPVGLLTVFLMGGFQMGVMTRIPDSIADQTIEVVLGTEILRAIGERSLEDALLVLSAPFFLILAWFAGPPLRRVLQLPAADPLLWRPRLLVAFSLAVTYELLVAVTPFLFPPITSALFSAEGWVIFITIVCAYLTALVMWNSAMWRSGKAVFRWLLLAALGAIPLILLSPIPGSPIIARILLFVALVMSIALSKGHGRAGGGSAIYRTGFVPAASLVALAVALDFAVIANRHGQIAWVGLIAAVGAVFVTTIVRQERGETATTDASKPLQGVNLPVFWFLAATCLLPYPCWMWVEHGFGAFLGSAGINAAWLGLIIVWVYFRVGRIIGWAEVEIRGNAPKIVRSLFGALPLFVLFSFLILLTAEIWEVAHDVPGPAFWAAIAVLVVMVLLVVVLAASQEVLDRNRFANAAHVFGSFAWDKVFSDHENLARAWLAYRYTDARCKTDNEKGLVGREKWNAVVAAAIFRLVVLAGATAATWVVLFGLSWLLVPSGTAAQWARIDSGTEPFDDVKIRFRVALLIAMVGMLNLATRVLQGGRKAGDIAGGFNERADRSLREQLAVRRVHRVLDPPSGPTPGPV